MYVHTLQLCLGITLQVCDSRLADDTHRTFWSTQILLAYSCEISPSPAIDVGHKRVLTSHVYSPDLPPPPIPPPAVLKSPTHPSKVALEGRGVISPKAGEGRDKKGGTGVYRPRDGSDHRTSSSERKDTQEKQRTTHGGKGNKHEGSAIIKARQHAGKEQVKKSLNTVCQAFLMFNVLKSHFFL